MTEISMNEIKISNWFVCPQKKPCFTHSKKKLFRKISHTPIEVARTALIRMYHLFFVLFIPFRRGWGGGAFRFVHAVTIYYNLLFSLSHNNWTHSAKRFQSPFLLFTVSLTNRTSFRTLFRSKFQIFNDLSTHMFPNFLEIFFLFRSDFGFATVCVEFHAWMKETDRRRRRTPSKTYSQQ